VTGGPEPTRLTAPTHRASTSAATHKAFPGQDPYAQTIFPIAYYDSVRAALKALEQVRGALSGGERHFRPALSTVRLDGPGTA
jgi:hypothetical protein